MRPTTSFISLVIVVAVFLSYTCKTKVKESPSEAVVAVYMAANGGWYSVAEKYIHSEILTSTKKNLGTLFTINAWDKFTRFGKIERIEILKEVVRGERADVSFKIHFKDGETKEDRDILIKEGGQWKILFDFA